MNTDIDGSPIVILSAEEAKVIYYNLKALWQHWGFLLPEEKPIAKKVSEALNLPPVETQP